MEALNRKPDLSSILRSMTLPDGTKIDVINITAAKQMQFENNKSLSDNDKMVHLTAAKMLVNGRPIVYDDLLNGFTAEEFVEIIKLVNNVTDEDIKQGIAAKNA